jgi:hypothetical protein
VRSGKEFRAYRLSPGQPIAGPFPFRLDTALELRSQQNSGFSEAPSSGPSTSAPLLDDPWDEEEAPDLEPEDELGNLSDLTDLESEPELPLPSGRRKLSPPSLSSFNAADYLPQSFSSPSAPPGGSDSASDSSCSETHPRKKAKLQPEDIMATGRAARQARKRLRKRRFRDQARREMQEKLGTKLKQVAQKRAAEASQLAAGSSFVSEDLPISSSAWAGVRQSLDKVLPELESLLGKDMELVPWDGK